VCNALPLRAQTKGSHVLCSRIFNASAVVPYPNPIDTLARWSILVSVCLLLSFSARATTLPPGFIDTQIASGLSEPTAMALAPDGGLFVCELSGAVRVIKDGALLPDPFVTVLVESANEHGLLGITLDPDFAFNHYVYVYYTAPTPEIHNRVSRFTAHGDVAASAGETIIFDLDTVHRDGDHNGGAIHFGVDGKLYIVSGDDNDSANAQTLSNTLGKILRLNADGSIPADNPFANSALGKNRAIWALGLRNPFTFAVQAGSGRLFINDVGESSWEEIDEGAVGANYGWPATEGYTFDSRFTGPVFAYGHGAGDALGCAITGGAFYDSEVAQFPPQYTSVYFFADLCNGWIRTLDPMHDNLVSGFAAGIFYPVDLKVDQNGNLYYLAYGDGSVHRVSYDASRTPIITTQPANQFVSVGQAAAFTVSASGAEPLSYQWQRDGVDINGATSPVLAIPTTIAADNGARFRCIVSNALGSATSSAAILSFNSNSPPVASIVTPIEGALYRGGEAISFSGVGMDGEDGDLPASAFTWQVDFYHEGIAHSFMPPTSGMKAASFSIPAAGETSTNVWFRIKLTVRDSDGLSQTVYRDLLPKKSVTTVQTNPAGLTVRLDGVPMVTPFSFEGVAGVIRTIDAPSPQMKNGITNWFGSWSDGGDALHEITIPESDSTLTATFFVDNQTEKSIFQFSHANYTVNEGDGAIAVTVTRSGNIGNDCTVDYASSDGTAAERSDYTTARGTLHFAPGETAKSFNVLITDDAYVEGDETVKLALSDPSANAELGDPATALLTIVDNDTHSSPNNPSDDPRFFIRQHYHDFLNREPDDSGWDYWTNEIMRCGDDADCVRNRRIDVSASFFAADEFQETGGFIYLLYQASYSRTPFYNEFTFDLGNVQAGPNLEASKLAFIAAWTKRPEFLQKYPVDMTGPQFVDALLGTIWEASQVDLSNQRDALIQEYNNAGRSSVLGDVVSNADFAAAENNSAFVLMEYFGYLRRDPDPGGYQFWLNVLNNRVPNGLLGYRAMVCAFITSIEYQDRFNSVYTHHNSECGQ
jgi:glucose/arabinose dehydrogenase